ncbi:helix-turn-helix domain-containing protein [Mesorhizobium sp. M0047]|uniref:helix-turn-helix domain-containing protein n=1 Tax=Mesorhizobium sp. M0047 TaxID=2956859 RepID=UPI003338283C
MNHQAAEQADTRAGGVEAVDRALSILGCFTEHDEGLSLAEISSRTGLYKSTILRVKAHFFFERREIAAFAYFRADCRHLIRDQIREGDVLSLDHHAAGQVLARFSIAKPRMRIALMAKSPFVSLGEGDTETATMAVPIFSGGEGLVGALAVSGPLTRFTPEKLVNMRPLLLEFGERLSTSLASSQYLQARS